MKRFLSLKEKETGSMNRLTACVCAISVIFAIPSAASAEAPARERELNCSDGTTFTAEQVRQGHGRPPGTWRNVDSAASPAAFDFFAVTVTAPDGSVVESETWDHSQGVERRQEMVTCSFIIPVGPFTDHRADFRGFFVPAS
jgi:hypothetical protein